MSGPSINLEVDAAAGAVKVVKKAPEAQDRTAPKPAADAAKPKPAADAPKAAGAEPTPTLADHLEKVDRLFPKECGSECQKLKATLALQHREKELSLGKILGDFLRQIPLVCQN